MKPWLLLACALLLTLVAYQRVRHATYVYEDENAVFSNPSVTGTEPIQWTRARVLTAVSHRLVWQTFGPSPEAPHLVNLGLHLVNGTLVFLIAGFWLSPFAAVLAASLFLLHPIQVESVAYVASRSELLACSFALLAYWRSLTAAKWREHGLVWLAVVLAVCAKESYAVIVPLMVVSDLYRGKKLSWVGLAAVVVPIGLMAWSVAHYEYVFRADSRGLDYAATQAFALWKYLGQVVVPYGLTIDNDFDLVPWAWRYTALITLIFIAGLPILALCSVRNGDTGQTERLWQDWPSLRIVAFGMVWVLVALLPRFLIPLNEICNLHQLYMPFLGVWLSVGAVMETSWA